MRNHGACLHSTRCGSTFPATAAIRNASRITEIHHGAPWRERSRPGRATLWLPPHGHLHLDPRLFKRSAGPVGPQASRGTGRLTRILSSEPPLQRLEPLLAEDESMDGASRWHPPGFAARPQLDAALSRDTHEPAGCTGTGRRPCCGRRRGGQNAQGPIHPRCSRRTRQPRRCRGTKIGAERFELSTSWSQTKRASQTALRPGGSAV